MIRGPISLLVVGAVMIGGVALVWLKPQVFEPYLPERVMALLDGGLGQALFERMIYSPDGRLINLDPLIYRVPMAEDLPPEFVTITQEQGHGPGPFGAKGAGEATILPVASAIANAIEDACGVRITEPKIWIGNSWPPIRLATGPMAARIMA